MHFIDMEVGHVFYIGCTTSMLKCACGFNMCGKSFLGISIYVRFYMIIALYTISLSASSRFGLSFSN